MTQLAQSIALQRRRVPGQAYSAAAAARLILAASAISWWILAGALLALF